MTAKPTTPSLLLTFDIEDWFQVENFKDWIPYTSWDNQESRVERSTHRILDLLDTVYNRPISPCDDHLAPERRDASTIKATFFVLGWIAERFPKLVAEIHARGHEVASHGYGHALANQMDNHELAMDLRRSKECLEDIISTEVSGYRAPSFSISDAVLHHIQGAGYRYDSSFNDFAMHDRYGTCSVCQGAKRNNGTAIDITPDFYEIPISNLKWARVTIPLGGGGYFRLMPFFLYREGVRRIISRKQVYVMYLHPWEFDPNQPRVISAPWAYRFRHSVNQSRTQPRLKKLIEAFPACEYLTCRQYIARSSPPTKTLTADARNTLTVNH
jgi:polysaccharide deacetylase family protein (PEP-CTERM system associated)